MGSKSAWTSMNKTNRWALHTMQNSLIHLQEHKPAQPVVKLIPPHPTKLNNKQLNVIKHRKWRGWVQFWNCTREREGTRSLTFSPEFSVNIHRKGSEDWERAGNKPLPEAGHVVDHRADLVNQRAASKIELSCRTEKQTANCNKTQTAEREGGVLIQS
jgi:hypothetical protein